MLPFVPRFAGQMIDRPRPQDGRRPIEAAMAAAAETHRRRGAERDAENMLEDRTVPVPANSGTRIVADQQRLDEFARR